MANQWNNMKIGNTFLFGSYAPEGNYKKLSITWQMFDMEPATSAISDRVFLLSQLDIMNYFPGEDLFFQGAEAEETEHLRPVLMAAIFYK